MLREMTNRGLSGLVSPGHWHHALANAGKGPAGVVVVAKLPVVSFDIVTVRMSHGFYYTFPAVSLLNDGGGGGRRRGDGIGD